MNTNEKEKKGEILIRKYHLWDFLFPENIGWKKITTKKKQLVGIDYEIYFKDCIEPVYVDLKSCIGPDYSMKKEDYIVSPDIKERIPAIPLELRQNGIFTNIHKATDYFLYIVQDDFGIQVTLAEYEKVKKLCEENDSIVVKNRNTQLLEYNLPLIEPKYTTYTSFNKTGKYIKVPATLFKTFTIGGLNTDETN